MLTKSRLALVPSSPLQRCDSPVIHQRAARQAPDLRYTVEPGPHRGRVDWLDWDGGLKILFPPPAQVLHLQTLTSSVFFCVSASSVFRLYLSGDRHGAKAFLKY